MTKVRRRIPSISLATVYKNVQTFLDSGMLREASLHHGVLRLEPNERPHHQLVCVRCKSMTDIAAEEMGPLRLRHRLPCGFRVQRIAVDVLGICEACSAAETRK